MENKPQAIAVFGNVTLDIICKTVDDVPRQASISFQDAAVTPGGCASNTAIGLSQRGERVYLIACVGDDESSELLQRAWKKTGVDIRFVQRIPGMITGVSVGLVDSDFQPRFIHTSGANGKLTKDFLSSEALADEGVGFLYVAGYFVLPGLLDLKFGGRLKEVQEKGIFTTLDVVSSPAMENPEYVWPLLPHLDLFLSNLKEAELITGCKDPQSAAAYFHQKGAQGVIIKLGKEGCFYSNGEEAVHLPAPQSKNLIDTTGAGDAFGAGLMAALRQGKTIPDACLMGNEWGSKNVEFLGAVKLS
jgi:sugar/nucleoside kinase (ribokinase family)